MMNEFSVKECYEERLNRLWDDARYSSLPFRERGYAAPAEVKVNALMFIGLNPSYQGRSSSLIGRYSIISLIAFFFSSIANVWWIIIIKGD